MSTLFPALKNEMKFEDKRKTTSTVLVYPSNMICFLYIKISELTSLKFLGKFGNKNVSVN